MFRPDGSLDTSRWTAESVELLHRAVESAVALRTQKLEPEHLVIACAVHASSEVKKALADGLRNAKLEHVVNSLETLLRDDSARVPVINLVRDCMSDATSAAFGDVLAWLRENGAPSATPPLLLYGALRNLGGSARDLFQNFLDREGALGYLERLLSAQQKEIVPFDPVSRTLSLNLFAPMVRDAMRWAALSAEDTGYAAITPSHVAVGLLKVEDGFASKTCRLFAPPSLQGRRPAVIIENAIQGVRTRRAPIPLAEPSFSPAAQDALKESLRLTAVDGASEVGESRLFISLLTHGDARLKSLLSSPPFAFDLAALRAYVEDAIRRETLEERRRDLEIDVPYSQDLTQKAREGRLAPIIGRREEIDQINRTLFKRLNGNAIVCGERGVGKTSLLHALALDWRQSTREIFQEKRFVRVDCRALVAAGETGLEKVLEPVRNRRNIVLALDDVDELISGTPGANETTTTARRQIWETLSRRQIQIVLTVGADTYALRLETDPDLMRFFDVLKLEEVSRPEAESILLGLKESLEQDYGAIIGDKVLTKAVRLSHDFLLNERLPAKAIDLVRSSCDRLRYDALEGADVELSVDHLAEELSRKTRLPVSTISGVGELESYEPILSQRVIGQEDAVRAVAQKLKLIHRGMADKRRPAAVVFFAGLTGTGKTELARAVAQIYSRSKKLLEFHMEEFGQAFTETGLIGVPAGYVGHENGGPLINALNADPYSVLLLDEVEKAHPEVLKPLLGLFDTGEITDRRNVKARAQRSFIIMTSNLCARVIGEGVKQGLPFPEVRKRFLEALPEEIDDRTHRPYFTPEFIGRIVDGIVLFKPLDETAMERIAEMKLAQLAEEWREGRDSVLVFEPSVAELIGRLSYAQEIKAPVRFGGRVVRANVETIVKPLLADNVERIMSAGTTSVTVENGAVKLKWN